MRSKYWLLAAYISKNPAPNDKATDMSQCRERIRWKAPAAGVDEPVGALSRSKYPGAWGQSVSWELGSRRSWGREWLRVKKFTLGQEITLPMETVKRLEAHRHTMKLTTYMSSYFPSYNQGPGVRTMATFFSHLWPSAAAGRLTFFSRAALCGHFILISLASMWWGWELAWFEPCWNNVEPCFSPQTTHLSRSPQHKVWNLRLQQFEWRLGGEKRDDLEGK